MKDRLPRGRGCFQILARQVEERESVQLILASVVRCLPVDVFDHRVSSSRQVSGQYL